MKKLQFPWARAELMEHLQYLMDPGSHVKEDPEFAGVDYAMHFVLDDSLLGEDPRSSVGYVLYSEEEAASAIHLANAMVEILNLYGKNADDSMLVSKPEWTAIAEASRSLLALMLVADQAQP